MERIRYSDADGKNPIYGIVREDGSVSAPDGYRYRDGYTTEDVSEPLIPLRRGYAVQSDGPHGWTVILRYPVSRVEGIFPWGDMTLVQDWGSRRKYIDLGLEWQGRNNPDDTGGFWQ